MFWSSGLGRYTLKGLSLVFEEFNSKGVVGIACGLAGAKKVTLSDVNAALHCLHDNAVLNELEVSVTLWIELFHQLFV